MTKNEKDSEILEKINDLSETLPEEEYQKSVEDEDPVELEHARKKLMLMINVKCKGLGQDIIAGQIKPMISRMNIEDCENMTQIIKKKGMYGLPLMLKTTTKHIG